MRTAFFALAFAALAAATPTSTPKRRSLALSPAGTSTPPSKDAFYDAPSGFQRAANGHVFKARPVWTPFGSEASAAYQVLYKTTLATGGDAVTAATLFVPLEPVSPLRIMVLAAPIDSACRDCEVTFVLQNGSKSNATDFLLKSVAIDIFAGLHKGWYVAVPDYEGPNAAYIASVQEAFGVIDGLRAMLNFPNVLPKTAGYKAVIHGYSGGAHASAWANQFLPTYGSKLNVVAAAYGGTPVSVSFDGLASISGGGSFLFWGALVGLSNAYPELDHFIRHQLFPNGTEAFEAARSLCNTQLGEYLGNESLVSFFRNGAKTFTFSTAVKYSRLGQLGEPVKKDISPAATTDGIVRRPTLMYHSSTDDITHPSPPNVESQCKQGAKILFETAPGLTHTTAAVMWTADAYNFLESAFDGKLKLDKCQQKTGITTQLGTDEFVAAIGQSAWNLIQSQMQSASSAGGSSCGTRRPP
ncbi:hypothetical protein JCM10296v2_000014 [Rhodotorula toruloides]